MVPLNNSNIKKEGGGKRKKKKEKKLDDACVHLIKSEKLVVVVITVRERNRLILSVVPTATAAPRDLQRARQELHPHEEHASRGVHTARNLSASAHTSKWTPV